MRLFDNKLSRINFLILIGILTYLFANMSNEDAYVEAILKASPSVINISSKKNNGTRLFNAELKMQSLVLESLFLMMGTLLLTFM